MISQLLTPLSRAIETAMSPFRRLAFLQTEPTAQENDERSLSKDTRFDRLLQSSNLTRGIDTLSGIDSRTVQQLSDLPSLVEATSTESRDRNDDILQRQLEVQEEIRDALTSSSMQTARFGR